jgi:hypothetical protein
LKEYFEKQKELKAQNEAAKKEYMKFFEKGDIQKVFEDNFDTISESYLKFCKTQKYTKKSKPSDFQINFNSFKKFGHDMKIYPNVISFDDFSHIFKTISKEKTKKGRASRIEGDEDTKETDSLHLTFNEFKDALTRISCLGKYKLGGLQGVSDEDSKAKEADLRDYLRNRWHKAARNSIKKENPKAIDANSSTIKTGANAKSAAVNNPNSSLNKQGSKADLNKSGSQSRYAFEKPSKLSKEEKAKQEHDLTMNAAKSFSLKSFKMKAKREKSMQRGSTTMPSIIYEDTELNKLPEMDAEFMTPNTVQSLLNYLQKVLETEKSGGSLASIKVDKVENSSSGASQAQPPAGVTQAQHRT